VYDLFNEESPFEAIAACYAVMAACPQHTFHVLTDGLERAGEFFGWLAERDGIGKYVRSCTANDAAQHGLYKYFDGLTITAEIWGRKVRARNDPWMQVFNAASFGPSLSNVLHGASIFTQADADKNIPFLLRIPGRRFLSIEPLIAPVNIRSYLMDGDDPGRCANCGQGHGFQRCPNYGGISKTLADDCHCVFHRGTKPCADFKRQNFAINWVIVGGESGHGARPMHPDWARSLRDQCVAAGVPFFFKQHGEYVHGFSNVTHCIEAHGTYFTRVGKKKAARLLDGRTWDEFPEARTV